MISQLDKKDSDFALWTQVSKYGRHYRLIFPFSKLRNNRALPVHGI